MNNSSDEPMTAVNYSNSYRQFYSNFDPLLISRLLSRQPEDRLNACFECCDRHAAGGNTAIFWQGEDGSSSTHSFEDLAINSARLADFLQQQGVSPGDRVACLLPRIPELFITALAVWRLGGVYVPLFTAFGPKAIQFRLDRSESKLLITDTGQRHKLEKISNCPPVMTVSRNGSKILPQDFSFHSELETCRADFEPVLRSAEEPFLLLFTSGTTGAPKGVGVPLKALLPFIVYMKYAIGLRPEDRYWNAADPGWAYGLFYMVIGPLLLGQGTHLYEGMFTADSTYRMLEKYRITSLAAAPTAYRLLMGAKDKPGDYDLYLERAVSCGEPLNPEAIRWVNEHLDCPVYDQYGQTEIGMVACNHHELTHEVIPGSMGMTMPGYRMAVLDHSGNEVEAGQTGQFAMDCEASPLNYFQGYWQQDSSDRYLGKYYLTGDTVELGSEGNFVFVGRGDDIITSAGYRIGPFDVESALIEHPAVAESGVVAKPDPERGEAVVAFVVLAPGHDATQELAVELQLFVRNSLSAHAYPREVYFLDTLPKTPSGKIQRFILKQTALAEN
jgi:acetyl-CoA synthetase